MGKILIIDGSGFKEDLKSIIDTYNTQNPNNIVDCVILPNERINTADEIKSFIQVNVNEDVYDVIFCHLRWIEENIEPLEQLKNSDWFQPILNIENRVGVSNGSGFRDRANELELFQYLYSHEGAKNALKEFLYE